jgi:hypothetical protein
MYDLCYVLFVRKGVSSGSRAPPEGGKGDEAYRHAAALYNLEAIPTKFVYIYNILGKEALQAGKTAINPIAD